ncbi:ABC transporter substrate-binding protein [Streptomyces tirandamycinicus]|uniref:ABC transporter substrate-binding protein n=1 Tax=Streptomyces tirandamycinicus TaxID=2174846 RepID=UPI002270A849|nr:extracellular solute-binding protein [Streptomyces tirandamycinicus]MCY0980179.1 extracellular solute-binding protein [Streptomyces tirandamycinicus]
MQRRYISLVAAVAALGTTIALAGCGGAGESDEVTLRLVAADYGNGAENSSQKYWDELADRFEAGNAGITVDVRVHSWKDVDREVAEMVADGNAPDIAQIGAYADYADQGRLYRVDELVTIPTQANFLPELSEAGQTEQVQYGLPFAASTRLLFFNEDLFADAGVGAPENWSQLRAAAERLKARGVTYPFALPLGSEESQAEAMIWMLSGGGGYRDRNGGFYAIDSESNVSTFTWLRDNLVTPGLTGPVEPGKLDRAQAFEAFTRGEVGMLSGHPTLMRQAEQKGIKVGMVPMPGVDGRARASMGVADWMMAFRQNGHRKEIGRFLDFAYRDENVLEFSGRYDILPVTVSASEAMAADGKHRRLWKFLEALPMSELYPSGEMSWAKVSASVKRNIGEAVAPQGDPAAVLKRIAGDAARAESEAAAE